MKVTDMQHGIGRHKETKQKKLQDFLQSKARGWHFSIFVDEKDYVWVCGEIGMENWDHTTQQFPSGKQQSFMDCCYCRKACWFHCMKWVFECWWNGRSWFNPFKNCHCNGIVVECKNENWSSIWKYWEVERRRIEPWHDVETQRGGEDIAVAERMGIYVV